MKIRYFFRIILFYLAIELIRYLYLTTVFAYKDNYNYAYQFFMENNACIYAVIDKTKDNDSDLILEVKLTMPYYTNIQDKELISDLNKINKLWGGESFFFQKKTLSNETQYEFFSGVHFEDENLGIKFTVLNKDLKAINQRLFRSIQIETFNTTKVYYPIYRRKSFDLLIHRVLNYLGVLNPD